MRTKNTLPFVENQLLSSNIESLIRHYQHYAPFRLAILGKMLSCNLTMPTLEMSLEWLAKQIGCCTKTVQRTLDDIADRSALAKEFRFHGKGREQANKYTLHPVTQSREFLELVAPYFHEIKLYLVRTARDYALSLMKKISQKVQTVKCALSALFNGGVQPFNSPLKLSYVSYRKQSNARTREGDETAKNSHRKGDLPAAGESCTKRGSMEEMLLRPIVKKISNQQRLKFTLEGSIALAGFSDKVLEAAYSRLMNKEKLNKQFGGFISICWHINKDLGLSYDWTLVRQLQTHFGVKDSGEKTLAKAGNGARTINDVFLAKTVNTPPIAAAPPKQIVSPAAQQPIAPIEPICKVTAVKPITLEEAQRCINNCKRMLPEGSPVRHSQIAFYINNLAEQGIQYVDN